MMECKDIILSICFKFKNENIQLLSFNGQSITFRFLSIKENYIPTYHMPISNKYVNKTKMTF